MRRFHIAAAAPRAALLLTAAIALFYGRALPRYFTSEDFLLLRFLHEHPPWHDLRELLLEPWLGISIVKFYRPVSTVIFAAEGVLFGTMPSGYNAFHLLIHGLNAALVWRIARRCGGEDQPAWTPLAIASIFSLYPLQPNAVLFVASFATLFSTTFLLLALDAYQRRRTVLSLGAFALALGSYEASVVLPGLLVAHDLVLPTTGPRTASAWRSAALRWAPYFALLGAYLVLRHRVLGVTLGGYEETGQRLLAPQLLNWAHDLCQSIWWLHVPVFNAAPTTGAAAASVALLILLPLVVCLWRWRSANDGRRWLFGWIWVALGLSPFAFQPVVPGNSRYWYFASIGLAMALCFLARWSTPQQGRWRRAPLVALGALGFWWTVLLVSYVGVYLEAGETARRIQQQILRLPAPGAPLFVSNHPSFLRNAKQVPLAQVYHYGLSDAVHLPFGTLHVPVYPLLSSAARELDAVHLGRPRSTVLVWNDEQQLLRPDSPATAAALPQVEVVNPPDGASLGPDDLTVEVVALPGAVSYRLLVVAEGNSTATNVRSDATAGTQHATMPREFVESMHRLYGSEMFWWMEARAGDGALLAQSALRGFRYAQ